MKKVFALVLALALVFSMATVAMAAAGKKDSASQFSNGDWAELAVKYTADEAVNISLTFGTLTNFVYTWDSTEKEWTTPANQTVQFSATNSGSGSKNVKLTADASTANTVVESAKFGSNAYESKSITNDGTEVQFTVLTVAAKDYDGESVEEATSNGMVKVTAEIL